MVIHLWLKYPPTPESAPQHAALCVAAAQLLGDVELDYSVESLLKLDTLIDRMRQDGATMEQMAETLFAFGCYVGEVFVRNVGGKWCRTEGSPLEGVTGFPLVLRLGPGNYCNPVGTVFKRLGQGAEQGLSSFYTLCSQRMALEARHPHALH